MQHITNNCGVPRTGAERTPDWPWGCHDELTLCQLILSPLNQGFCLSGCLCVTVCLQVITSWFRLFQVDNTSIYIISRENSYDLIWSVVYLQICIPPKKDSANLYLDGLLALFSAQNQPYPLCWWQISLSLYQPFRIIVFLVWCVSKCTVINFKIHF